MTRFLPTLRAVFLASFSLPFLAGTAWAQQQLPQSPEIAAKSYLLLDVNSNQILAGKDIDAPVEPASLTKLMSVYVVFDALKAGKITLEQKMPVSERAWKTPGSRMFIDPKMQVPVEDLLKGVIVQSGNDAMIALAEGVGGTVEHFVEMMNAESAKMGLKNTTWKNPDGLPEPGHITTARDLSTVALRLYKDFPKEVGLYAIKHYRYPGTPASNDTNRNTLLFRDPTVDGLKTGHTQAAGYCLIATASRDVAGVGGRRLISVLLGATSANGRANESQKLLNWGYTAYDDVKLFDANQPVVSPEVWKGTSKTLPLGRPEAIVVSVPAGSGAKVKTEISRPDPLVAPFQKGQAVGSVKVKLGDQVLREEPLVALQDVPQAGLLGRAWDSIRLWIK